MKNNNDGRREQKLKPYPARTKYNDRDRVKKTKSKKEIVSEDILFERASVELKALDIFVLEIKAVTLNKGDNHIDAVIHKAGSVSHEDCVHTTKTIQSIIEDLSLDTDDYSITVSSAGFTWVFKSNLEYELFLGNKIKIKYIEGEKNITLSAVLKENDADYIVIENEDIEQKKIDKKDIIKIRLNN